MAKARQQHNLRLLFLQNLQENDFNINPNGWGLATTSNHSHLIRDMYLYILKFTDEQHLKIGISKEWYRMRKVHHAYEIDIDKSLYVWGKEDDIREYEKRLKKLTLSSKVSKFTSNGKTEIRDIKCLDVILKFFEDLKIPLKTIGSTPNAGKLKKPRKPRTVKVVAEKSDIVNKIIRKRL